MTTDKKIEKAVAQILGEQDMPEPPYEEDEGGDELSGLSSEDLADRIIQELSDYQDEIHSVDKMTYNPAFSGVILNVSLVGGGRAQITVTRDDQFFYEVEKM